MTENGFEKIKSLPKNGKLVTINNGTKLITDYLKSSKKEKECIKINTMARYNITAGVKHPFCIIKKDGRIKWVKANKLEIGDVLIMAKPSIVQDSDNQKLNELARLVGYFIGDGCYNKQSFNFTNSDEIILTDMINLMYKNYNINPRKHIRKRVKDYYKEVTTLVWNKETKDKFIKETNLKIALSGKKVIPTNLIVPNKTVLENLLFGLYQTDGSIRTNGISFTSTSQKLLMQIQEILLLLGVDSHRINYEVRVYGYNNLQKLPLICNESKHRERIKLILERRNSATEVVPLGSKILITELNKKAKGYGKWRKNSIRKQFKSIGIGRNALYTSSGKNKQKFAQLCDKFNLPHLKWLTCDNIFFDKIKSLEKVGKKTCYDLHVPETNTFIANGFYTHNSAMLTKLYDILGSENCIIMSDVSHAALRGTVEHGTFIMPFTLKRPFAIATELGQIVNSDEEIIQKLLNVLEEGVVNVTLAKVAGLSLSEIDRVRDEHKIEFIDNNSFTYRTNWVLFGATYNKRFLSDEALESRFNIVMPNKPLNTQLIRHVHQAPKFNVDAEAVELLRKEIHKPEEIDTTVKLPDEVYNYDLSPRDYGMLMSTLLCKKWWELKLVKDDIVEMASKIQVNRDSIWKTSEDRVFDILFGQTKTISEIMETTGLSQRTTYNAIRNLRAIRYDEDGEIKYAIK